MAADIQNFDTPLPEDDARAPAEQLLHQRAAAASIFIEHINQLHRPLAREIQTLKNFVGEKLRK